MLREGGSDPNSLTSLARTSGCPSALLLQLPSLNTSELETSHPIHKGDSKADRCTNTTHDANTHDEASSKLERLAACREPVVALLNASISSTESSLAVIKQIANQTLLETQASLSILTKHRISQVSNSDRRLRELSFECLCEFKKLNANGTRQRFSCLRDCWSTIVNEVWEFRWKRFARVLENYLTTLQSQQQLPSAKCEVVSFNNESLPSICMKIWDEVKLVHPHVQKNVSPSVVVHIKMPLSCFTIEQECEESPTIRIHNNIEELSNDLCCAGLPTSREKRLNDVDQPRSNLSSLLCARSIEWLHPPSYCFNLFAECSQSSEQFFMRNHSCRLASARIYFCLEERSYYAYGSQTTDGLFDVLVSLYVSRSSRIQSVGALTSLVSYLHNIRVTHLRVCGHCNNHRTKENIYITKLNNSAVSVFPDVIQVSLQHSGTHTLHFAPAFVSHLFETATFHRISDHITASQALLTRLYVCVQPDDVTDPRAVSLIPLSHSCVAELIRVHTRPHPSLSDHLPAIMQTLPDHQIWRPDAIQLPLRHKYLLYSIRSYSNELDRTVAMQHYFLFQLLPNDWSVTSDTFGLWKASVTSSCGESPEDAAKFVEHLENYERSVFESLEHKRTERSMSLQTVGPRGSRRKSSATATDNFCAWRACYAKIVSSSNTCERHSQVAAFLGNRNGKKLCAKYLYSKPPAPLTSNLCSCQKQLNSLRQKHTLVYELQTGKLSATVRTFYKRVSQELSLSQAKFLHAKQTDVANCKPSRVLEYTSPRWRDWKDEGACSNTVKHMQQEFQLLKRILQGEREASQQLTACVDAGLYPLNDYIAFKRDYRALLNLDVVDETTERPQDVQSGLSIQRLFEEERLTQRKRDAFVAQRERLTGDLFYDR